MMQIRHNKYAELYDNSNLLAVGQDGIEHMA